MKHTTISGLTLLVVTCSGLASSARAEDASPDWCEVPDEIDEDALYLAVEALPAASGAPRSWPAWDHTRTPERWPEVARHVKLRQEDEALIRRQGFAVTERAAANPAHAYASLYTRHLPIFVTMESLMWAVAVGHQAMLAAIESEWVTPELGELLDRAHAAARPTSPLAKVGSVAARRDADLYLTVARSLFAGVPVAPHDPENREAAVALVRAIEDPTRGLVVLSLFGRERALDLSLYTPRGPYAETEAKRRWFRALTWLTRLELNLVSRECRSSEPGFLPDPRETPHEAEVAAVLSHLFAQSGLMPRLMALSRALDEMIAPRVDASAAELATLTRWGPGGFDHPALVAAIGERFARTAPTHPMPPVDELPVVWTLLGLRATESTEALASFLTPTVPQRIALGGAEVAVALGHPTARRHLADELRAFPELTPSLDAAHADFVAALRPDTLRGSWLAAILALAEPVDGVVPSFTRTEAWRDFTINTALSAYARLRRNHVAYEAAAFTEGGCEVPDGFVEPAPAVLAGLLAYARRGQALAATIDPAGIVGVERYYRKMGRVLSVLGAIVQRELAGLPLARAERDLLHQIVERRENIYDATVKFDGWFIDLMFSALELRTRPGSGAARNVPEADELASIVVDVATAIDAYAGAAVSHLGTSETRLGVFVVDTGGAPRALVGPVSLAYGAVREHPERLSDRTARRLPRAARHAPWTRSFAPSYEREKALWPATTVEVDCWPREEWDDSRCREVRVSFEGDEPGDGLVSIGPVEVALLDPRDEVIATQRITPRGRTALVRFSRPRTMRTSDEDGPWTRRVAEVRLRRGLDEWRIALEDMEEAGFPRTRTFGPGEDEAATFEGDGDDDGAPIVFE